MAEIYKKMKKSGYYDHDKEECFTRPLKQPTELTPEQVEKFNCSKSSTPQDDLESAVRFLGEFLYHLHRGEHSVGIDERFLLSYEHICSAYQKLQKRE